MRSTLGSPNGETLKITKICALTLAATFAAGLTLLPTDANAQFGRRHRRVVVAPSGDWVVRPLVDTAERQSNAFRAYFESHDAKGRLGRYHDNKFLKRQIQKMDEAFERLRGKADDHCPGIGKGELQQALDHARTVDHEIYYAPETNRTIREWTDLRGTFNDLARLYGVRGV